MDGNVNFVIYKASTKTGFVKAPTQIGVKIVLKVSELMVQRGSSPESRAAFHLHA